MRELLASGKIDLVTFTSSSTVTNFCELIGAPGKGIRAAAIGPITAATAEERGFEVVVMPRKYTIEALTEAIRDYFVKVKKRTDTERPGGDVAGLSVAPSTYLPTAMRSAASPVK